MPTLSHFPAFTSHNVSSLQNIVRDSSIKSGLEMDSITMIERFKFAYPAESTINSATQLKNISSKNSAKMNTENTLIAVPSPRACEGSVSTATQR